MQSGGIPILKLSFLIIDVLNLYQSNEFECFTSEVESFEYEI